MPALTISNWRGARPKITPRALPESFAQKAQNCDLDTGQLRPAYLNDFLRNVPHSLEVQTLFDFDSNWLAWNTDVDVVTSSTRDDHIFYTGDGFPKQTSLTLATSNTEDTYPSDYRRLGVLPPDSPLTVSLTPADPADDADIIRSVAYVYTLITTWNEESAPSDPTGVYDIYENQTATLKDFSYPSGSFNNYTHYRIYRINTGSSEAIYQFVDEIDVGVTSYDDSKSDDQLGEALPTTDWDAPVGTLKGLGEFVQGILVGFDGQDLYFSEPWVPYAWPAKYSLSFNENIVGWGYFEETIVVCTSARPYLVTGSDPKSMAVYPLPYNAGCTNKRGIANTPFGVVFPAPDGLYMVNSSGLKKVTEDIYTNRQWWDMGPESVHCTWYNGNLYVFWQNKKDITIIDFNRVDIVTLDLNKPFYCSYKDSKNDILYLVVFNSNTNEYEIYKIAKRLTSYDYTYQTREFILPYPVNYNTAQVYGEYDNNIYQSQSTLNIYVNGGLVFSKTVTGPEAFRLPPFYARSISFEIIGQLPIDMLSIATSPKELMT